MDEEIDWW